MVLEHLYQHPSWFDRPIPCGKDLMQSPFSLHLSSLFLSLSLPWQVYLRVVISLVMTEFGLN